MSALDTFSKRVQAILNIRGMKQSDLYELTGLRSYNCSSWKNGSSPSLEKAASVAKALDVSLDWLADLTDEVGPGLKPEEEQLLVNLYRTAQPDNRPQILAVVETMSGDARAVPARTRRAA